MTTALAVLVVAGVGLGLRRSGGAGSEIEVMRTQMETVRAAARQWQVWYGDAVCPSIRQTIEGKYLDAKASKEDIWGRPFVISCPITGLEVISLGPDGKKGTADDVVVSAPNGAPRSTR